ncbi:acyltransferase 3 [Bifidobacterium ramosum]|uniref:Acyltransferase 3 n=1 Tax=Bifidobacterium ramosum TaxID=1798158 RepID=A0A6L4X2C7_9BIFI|nr:acyltransferase [Bifidobacterium ramosum]KAB8289151.1 acyltransferase 3 [Bifidobacterium ramosum]NEG70860.1 acyltransferase family protein [Bifidobacterium ramosum]
MSSCGATHAADHHATAGAAHSGGTGRVPALDGLRGIACLVVLCYHLAMMFTLWGADAPYGLIPGPASVMVFFALSGVVLSLAPFAKLRAGQAYDWLRYYPRRVVRLAVPTFVAIAMGIGSGFVAWRLGSQSRSAQSVDFSGGPARILHDVLMQFDLIFNISDGVSTLSGGPLLRADSPVWSMTWEMFFSLTLPLAVYCVARTRRDLGLAVALVAAIWCSHVSGYFPLRLCLMFWLGVLLAKRADRIAAVRVSTPVEVVAFVAAVGCIELPEFWRTFVDSQAPVLLTATWSTLMNVACAALVALTMADGLLRRLLSTRPMRFLGRISFSLYLTHAILFGGFAVVLPRIGLGNVWAQSLIALVVAFAFAWLFYVAVERPSMRWSHDIGHAELHLEP